jgi:uncharacterized protein (TIGR03083 family)
MQLTPRYDGEQVLRLEAEVADPAAAMVRQRERFAAVLAGLDDEQWAAPSRCEGWTVQDVVDHLVGTNQFWAISITSGLAGEPTRYLAAFDPVATPAQMVAATDTSPAETLERFMATTGQLAGAVAGLDGDGWATLAEAPPGHVAVSLVVLHALWDSWVHERDVLLPLGLVPAEEPDEIAGSLTYASAIGPTLLACGGSTRPGVLGIDGHDPEVRLVVECGEQVVIRSGSAPHGAPVLAGPAVDLVEALTFRVPFDPPPAERDRWLFRGLAEAFDQVPQD